MHQPEQSKPINATKTASGVRTKIPSTSGMHHAVLSQYPLQSLARLGENVRRLHRMERELRTVLKPSGMLRDMLFDRGWSSYLRCVLAARAEGMAILPNQRRQDLPAQTPRLVEGDLPMLTFEASEVMEQNLSPNLFRQKHRNISLGLLLLLKNGGEAGLEQLVENAMKIRAQI
jgi:hypothetical protein